jgi:hypothetical protein
MRLSKHILMAALIAVTTMGLAGSAIAQDQTPAGTDSLQWSSWAKPSVGKSEQGFAFRGACAQTDQGLVWYFQVRNDMANSYSLTGAKNAGLGTVDSRSVLDAWVPASNCKKQPELNATEIPAQDDSSGLWYTYSYKDGKAKGKLHDANGISWLDVLSATAAGLAAAQGAQ